MLTLREQMTLHRTNPTCAGCHKIMDPIGFALDNFDADGKWRTKQGGDGGTPIDASVDLYDGQHVDGPVGLRQALLRYSPQFVRMFTEKMMTYALGRGVEYSDMPDDPRDRGGCGARTTTGSRRSCCGVVKSAQFQMRVKEAAEEQRAAPIKERDMFITKKHIPRRTFLRGAGVTLGLAAARIDGAGA